MQTLLESGIWRIKKIGADEVLKQYQDFKKQFLENHEAISKAMKQWFNSLGKEDPRKNHSHYSFSDDRGLYFPDNFAGPDDGRLSRPRYDIIHPTTLKPCKKPSTGWRWDEERTKRALLEVPPLIHFGIDETTIPCRKSYLKDIDAEPFASVFYKDGRGGTITVERLLEKGLFNFPKDVDVLSNFIKLSTKNNDIVLDFFAGSATTAHAVIELNKEDELNRKFICVQIPEPIVDAGNYKTIADISKARIRKVIENVTKEKEKIKSKNEAELFGTSGIKTKIDLGFKAYKLSKSNFKVWDTTLEKEPELIQQKLFEHIQHISPEAQQEAILYELLLKSGFELTTPIETLTLAGKTVFSIADGQLLICLEKEITHDCIKAMAEKEPSRVICLDEAFNGTNADALKTNAVQIMKSKGVVNFRTV